MNVNQTVSIVCGDIPDVQVRLYPSSGLPEYRTQLSFDGLPGVHVYGESVEAVAAFLHELSSRVLTAAAVQQAAA